jgi:hypothetical protein
MESENGWWLITHQDHARLAGAFAAAWGNDRFRRPEPRDRVLHGIACHDDGWAVRDIHPSITKQGKPSAFSSELVGKYSAFEEIDLSDYLAVRERAVRIIAESDSYAGLLISMHTYNLLSERADRRTITPDGSVLIDQFLERQRSYQQSLIDAIKADDTLAPEIKEAESIHDNFKLLQACDNLSLLACVSFDRPADLLHPLPLSDGSFAHVQVAPIGARHFRLSPWPFIPTELTFHFPAKHVIGRVFESSEQLDTAYRESGSQMLTVLLTA